MDFNAFSFLALNRFSEKTKDRLNRFEYNFHNCISNQKLIYILFNEKKDFLVPTKCCNCLEPTDNKMEMRDSRYIKRTTYEDTMKIFKLKIPICKECEKKLEQFSIEYPNQIKKRIFNRKFLLTVLMLLGALSFIFSLRLVTQGTENIITNIIGVQYSIMSVLFFIGVIPLVFFYLGKYNNYKLQKFVKENIDFKIPEEIVQIATTCCLYEDKGIFFNNEQYADLFCKSNELKVEKKFKITNIIGHTYDFIEEKKQISQL